MINIWPQFERTKAYFYFNMYTARSSLVLSIHILIISSLSITRGISYFFRRYSYWNQATN